MTEDDLSLFVEVDEADKCRDYKALQSIIAGLPDLSSPPLEQWEPKEPQQKRRRIKITFDTVEVVAQAALALYPKFRPG
jgi:hypothetical protein